MSAIRSTSALAALLALPWLAAARRSDALAKSTPAEPKAGAH